MSCEDWYASAEVALGEVASDCRWLRLSSRGEIKETLGIKRNYANKLIAVAGVFETLQLGYRGPNLHQKGRCGCPVIVQLASILGEPENPDGD
jgi:hypothetical protein